MDGEDKQIEEQAGSDNDQENQDGPSGFEDREDLQCRFYRNEWPETEELVAVSLFSHYLLI